MTGRELLAGVSHRVLRGTLDGECGLLTYDSRLVTPGTAFVAMRGAQTDGHDYIHEAVERGAALIVAEREMDTAHVVVENSRLALANLAANFHGQPAQSLKLIGITGTNGKTSVAFLLRHILQHAGKRSGLIGTVEYDLGDRVLPATRTTPESPELHEAFAAMARAGCEFCVMEVSSHALAQHRVAGLMFSGAVFTNLTQDHLDYHDDMTSYFAVKRQLFEMTLESAALVSNSDDDFGKQLAQDFPAKTFGERESDFQIAELNLGQTGSRFRIGETEYRIPLIGRHNVSNAAAAIALAQGLGLTVGECATALVTTEPVPGRLEPIDCGQSFAVFVDYAHTDDALRQVLSTLRDITPGKLRVLFGCGGNRDAGKRFKMGAAAAELAESICITTDNPRRENPETIARQVAEGCASICATGWRMEPDRERAIDEILREAEPDDTVLIAGKGHETYQEIADTIFPFDDRETARRVLAAIEGAR